LAYSDPSDYRDNAGAGSLSGSLMDGLDGPVVNNSKRAAFGLLRIAIGAALFISAISYSALDSTRDTAGSSGTLNALGGLGAGLANLTLQMLGWAVMPLALMMLYSGVRGVFRPLTPRSRLGNLRRAGLVAFASLFCALLFASAPVPQSWPMATGLGGWIGDQMFSPLTHFMAALKVPFGSAVIGLIAFLSAGFCIGRFMGLVAKDAVLLADAAGLVWAAIRVYIDRLIAWLRVKFNKAYVEDVEHGALPQQWAEPDVVAQPEYAPVAALMPAPAPKPAAKRRVAKTAKANAQFNFPAGSEFVLPHVDLLKTPPMRRTITDEGQLRKNAELLATTLSDFGVKGQIGQVRPGPVVTLYEFEPAPGVKSSRVINLADDIARSMAAESARVAVVPGRNAIGIELPNRRRETVWLRNMLDSRTFKDSEAGLPMAMGEDIGGQPFIADLSKMPHLLVAGTTGSGKSVGINAMILSIMYTLTPEQCKFIMIDPKMLELSVYDGIPHLLAPVVTEPKKAVVALKWTVREMESRYRAMAAVGVRNMAGYNEKAAEALRSGEPQTRTVMTGYNKESGEPIYETETLELKAMPYIVVVIDEMADLMMVAGKDIEGTVQRLAQMARAAGIHMIMATQRPSVDVITGTIKANFPTRVSFRVGSKIDSRTILGEQGGEQLLGNGDMLFMGTGRPLRLHGPFVSDDEVEQIANFVKAQGSPSYLEDITIDKEEEAEITGDMMGEGKEVSLFDKAVAIVANDRKASTSYIQRRLGIGYNKAANLVEQMEREGMIGPSGPGGKREIFLPEANGF
jgi:S-DNA-T family DNA segregation ATPase FtsK/SpoIIIE